jgi:UDP-2,3-diacylglucosamine pyrophosphatase LpxH
MILGDVTHSPSKLTRTLKLFKLKFKDVYYCPGNHELWTESEKEDEQLNIHNSIEKFHYVKKMTRK